MRNREYLPISEILNPCKEKVVVSSLSELLDHVQKRETYYTAGLAEVARQIRMFHSGWQILDKVEEKIEKEPAQAFENGALFTANSHCIVGAVALAQGIYEILDSNHLQREIKILVHSYEVAYNRENWELTTNANFEMPLHTILSLSDSEETYYVDPTYAQIDHRWVGRCKITKKSDADHAYGSGFLQNIVQFNAESIFNFYTDEFNELCFHSYLRKVNCCLKFEELLQLVTQLLVARIAPPAPPPQPHLQLPSQTAQQ